MTLTEEEVLVTVHVTAANHDLQFLIAHDGVAALGIELIHHGTNLNDKRIGLIDGIITGETEIAV